MNRAGIKCARCPRNLEFGGISRSLAGSVARHDALAGMAQMLGWSVVGVEWRCPNHTIPAAPASSRHNPPASGAVGGEEIEHG